MFSWEFALIFLFYFYFTKFVYFYTIFTNCTVYFGKTHQKCLCLFLGGTVISAHFNYPHFGPPALMPSHSHHPHHRSHPQPTYYSPQVVYWPYPSPPVSPTYYGHPHSTHSQPPQHYAGTIPPLPQGIVSFVFLLMKEIRAPIKS